MEMATEPFPELRNGYFRDHYEILHNENDDSALQTLRRTAVSARAVSKPLV